MVATVNASDSCDRCTENKQFLCSNRKDILRSKLLGNIESVIEGISSSKIQEAGFFSKKMKKGGYLLHYVLRLVASFVPSVAPSFCKSVSCR